MTKSGRYLPDDVVEHWPEVFGEVTLNVLPLKYLSAVLINFKDGKTWEITVTSKTKKQGWDAFENSMTELFKSYENKIIDVDFKLDTKKIKADIENKTQNFLKKKKLK